MRRFLLAMSGILVTLAAFADDAAVPLKAGAGEEATSVTCGTCHTTNYIPMNSPFLTGEQWKAEVTKMRKAFGAPMDDDTAAEIIGYLSINYSAAKKP